MEKLLVYNKNGITLIALVITIIVLLILAGVSIAMLTDDNGILTQAQNAKEQTGKTSELEGVQLAVMSASMKNNGYAEVLDTDSFKQELQNQFGNEEVNVTPNKDGSFIVTINNRRYYVNDDKTVIDNENIVEISTKEELEDFRDDVNSGNTYDGKVVLLTNDITLSGEWEPIGIYQQNSTNPNDEENIPFKGIFDGGFHTISGMNTNEGLKNRGLFGFIKESTVKNVGIVDSDIQGTSRTGAIVGYAYQNSRIANCYNSSKINSTDNFVGGIAGYINKQTIIENCYNTGNITSTASVGGIVGGIGNSTVKNCYNVGIINGKQVGGISFGVNESALIENCYNAGNLTRNGNDSVIVSINCTGNDSEEVTFKNNYYLENTVNGANDIFPQEECEVKSSEEMKNLYEILGDAYKEGKNNGYPILFWQ